MNIAFFGSSLVSCYWNGAATYYRGLLRELARRGHRVRFYEPDSFDRQAHRDMPDPPWADVRVYPADEAAVLECLDEARWADLVVKASGVGVFDELLEREVLALREPARAVVYWDVDAPATLERLTANPDDPFRPLIPRYDLVFTYGGGKPVIAGYRGLGARECVPIYNALDPETHHPEPASTQFAGTLGFLGNRMPDRERRVREFFFGAAEALPRDRFLLGGSGWDDAVSEYPNLVYLGHVGTRDHNAFNCSVRAVLNVNRESMARFGYSPPTRVFEAAGAGACLITDLWPGIEEFLAPGEEILTAGDGAEVAAHLEALDAGRARRIGATARTRILAEHTYHRRAAQVEAALDAPTAGVTARHRETSGGVQ